jgi:hypothetical protein
MNRKRDNSDGDWFGDNDWNIEDIFGNLGDEGGISAGYGGILIAKGGEIHENHTKLMEAMK